jgi:hypothetical protein
MIERVALITALILDRPMCLECITTRAAMPLEEIVAVIELIAGGVTVHHQIGPCVACRNDDRPTVSVDQPGV